MQNFVEFYFPGVSCAGQKEREVELRAIAEITSIPDNAISCRFFSKDEDENKIDFSPYYFFGKEYDIQEFKTKYPQLAAVSDFASANRIVKARTGRFYPLSDDDIVVSA